MKISAVIPAYNEEGNVGPLYHELKKTLEGADAVEDYEIIFVDDGSTDHTFSRLASLREDKLRVIRIEGNTGLSNALRVGCEAARHEIIVALDADGQSDPSDIPGLLDKMREGYDCVCGWRHERRDPFVKRVSATLANSMRRWVLGDDFQDITCPLKVFKKKCIEGIAFFNGIHRFYPHLMRLSGHKVVEVKVKHHPRRSGKSKYGVFNRFFKVLRDVFYVRFVIMGRQTKARR